MMTILAGAFTALSGGWVLRLVTIPLIGLLALTGFHLCIESWKGNLRAAGAAQCDAKWEARVTASVRKTMGEQLNTANALLGMERATSEKLNNELETVREKYDGLLVGTDRSCLSDSVLQRMGGSGPVPLLGRPLPAGGKDGVPQPHQARPAKPAVNHDQVLQNETPKR